MWIVALVLTLATVDGPAVSLQTLDGAKVAGKLVDLSRDGVTLETASGRKKLPLGELLELTPNNTPPKSVTADTLQNPANVCLELIDGSKLIGSEFTVKGSIARLKMIDTATTSTAHPQSTIDIPTRQITAVRLQPQNEETSLEWKRIRGESSGDDTSGDLLVTRKGSTLDYHRGVVADVSEKTVSFNLDGDVLPVRRAKVFALIYQHTSSQSLPSSLCRLESVDGSYWAVQSIALRDGMLSFETPCGLAASLPPASVERLDFSRGKAVYLDDLTPQSANWTPYFGGLKESQTRRSLFGPRVDHGHGVESIRLAGKEFSRGISLHSRSEVVYRLDDDFRRFRAIAGIDDRARPRGHVRLIVRGDERVLLDTTISGNDEPRPLDLDLGGADRLTIIVDFGDGLDVGDQLGLGNARVVK
ncbi:MAG: NPCBM/NEW2 domain-containing protein [Pirellulales bacterium]|nr:NPCBM/NEW2 domain-containing protein [Pirellulales bacterium]